MAKNVLVLHGPNVNLLGERVGDTPGQSLPALDARLREAAAKLGLTLKIAQSNHEGVLVDRLHGERAWAAGVVLNPGALAATSYVLRDAIAAIRKPTYEVHLTSSKGREPWRQKSVLEDVVVCRIEGFGYESYVQALEKISGAPAASASKASPASRTGSDSRRTVELPRMEKSIGRKPVPKPAEKAALKSGGKSLGRGAAKSMPPSAGLTRARVREKIAEQLSGRLTAEALAAWARAEWLDAQSGSLSSSEDRELLEDTLQTLTLSNVSARRLSDHQLVELMARLG